MRANLSIRAGIAQRGGAIPPQRRLTIVAGAIAALLLAWLPAVSPAWAQDVADGGYVCPVVPEALVRRRAATGDPPVPSAADLAAYHAYVALLQANDWAYLCRYRDENRYLSGKPHPRVVLLGDSITENWKQRDAGLFVDGIIDRGIGGQTSPQMLLRFTQDVIALHPNIVQIMAGTNDIAENTGPTSDTQYQDNIRAMVSLAHAHGIAVILASIPPARAFPWKPNLRPPERIARWNAWLKDLARAEGCVFVDYHAVLTDEAGGLRPAFDSDGVHPSHAGYLQMDPLFETAVAQAERLRAARVPSEAGK